MIVSKDGFKQVMQADVVLQIQDVLSLNFGLQVGSVSETVTVTGGAPMVNTTDAAVSPVIDQSYVQNMPLNGGNTRPISCSGGNPGRFLSVTTLASQKSTFFNSGFGSQTV